MAWACWRNLALSQRPLSRYALTCVYSLGTLETEFIAVEEHLDYAEAGPKGYKALAALDGYVERCGLDPLLLDAGPDARLARHA
jgi:hypothetical protein